MQFDPAKSLALIKKLPFSKSWQNVYVSKAAKKILNRETETFEEKEMEDFIYLPASALVRHFGSDKEFLLFRSDNKLNKDWDYKLVSDATENNNRRLAVKYAEALFAPLNINFTIDDSYTIYINNDEIKKLSEFDIPGAKEFVNGLYIPKIMAHKKGVTETFTN